MASGFPGAIDSFTNPLTTSALNSPSHAGQHQDLNDAVNKIETYMGLVYITSSSATSGTTLNVDNCFTSLYSNYRLVITTFQTSIAANLTMQLRVGGSTTATNVYYSNRQRFYYNAAAPTYDAGSGISSWWMPCLSESTRSSSGVVDVYNPQNALLSGMSGQGYDVRVLAGTGAALSCSGFIDNTTQYDGFTLVSSQTITQLTVRVYGYRN